MKNTKAILEPDCTYHIFNRANGNEKLFLDDDNYRYFLKKYEHYISPITDTFYYCLMPNHFHFLVRIKSEKDMKKAFPKFQTMGNPQGFQNLEGLVSKQFGNLFNSYSKAFNKQQGRKGSLFMHPFKRIKVTDESYLKKLVNYIHMNPVEAKLSSKPKEWKHSSYPGIVSNRSTLVLIDEVLSWFDDRENFIHCHRYPPEMTGIDNL